MKNIFVAEQLAMSNIKMKAKQKSKQVKVNKTNELFNIFHDILFVLLL